MPPKNIRKKEISQPSSNPILYVCVYVCSQVCVKDSNSIEIDSDVSVEIPPGTVIAYSILELEVKKDGQYCECV